MGEIALGHEAVAIDGTVDFGAMDPNGDAHGHMLWPFGDVVVDVARRGL